VTAGETAQPIFMTSPTTVPRVVEKYYSARELSFLLGFDEKWWRERAKAGEFTIQLEGHEAPLCQVVELGGELRIPATAVNHYLAQHPYRYDAGVKARNKGELRRKLSQLPELAAA